MLSHIKLQSNLIIIRNKILFYKFSFKGNISYTKLVFDLTILTLLGDEYQQAQDYSSQETAANTLLTYSHNLNKLFTL